MDTNIEINYANVSSFVPKAKKVRKQPKTKILIEKEDKNEFIIENEEKEPDEIVIKYNDNTN